MIPTFHDASVLGYSVRCCERALQIDFELPDSPNEKQSILFSGVEAYHFENDAFGNIVGLLEEIQVLDLYHANSDQILAGYQQSGSPGPWAASHETALKFLSSNPIRGFVLHSCYGLSGWVMARGFACAA